MFVRALGQQAYCTVVAAMMQESQRFRVLALSATPGDNLSAVQEVINNLVRPMYARNAWGLTLGSV